MTSTYAPDAGTSAAWELARAQLDRPRPVEPGVAYLNEELALRDLVARYAYTFDRGDLDGVMSFFTDDATVSNTHGTASGSAAIRANYEGMLNAGGRRRHLFGNVLVRLSDDLSEAWTCVYHSAVLEGGAAAGTRAVNGLICDNLVKRDGRWQVRARSVCIDSTAGLLPYLP